MENIVLVVHLILALCLVGAVLLQRSEGGGLGVGGGGGGAMSSRGAATALGKMTWALAAAFIATSIVLTVIAAQNAAGTSVVDRLGMPPQLEEEDDAAPALPAGEDLLPPQPTDAPAIPPRAD